MKGMQWKTSYYVGFECILLVLTRAKNHNNYLGYDVLYKLGFLFACPRLGTTVTTRPSLSLAYYISELYCEAQSHPWSCLYDPMDIHPPPIEPQCSGVNLISIFFNADLLEIAAFVNPRSQPSSLDPNWVQFLQVKPERIKTQPNFLSFGPSNKSASKRTADWDRRKTSKHGNLVAKSNSTPGPQKDEQPISKVWRVSLWIASMEPKVGRSTGI